MKPSSTSESAFEASSVSLGDPTWGAFVAAHPEALAYHHPAWAEAIVDTYGFESFAFVVRSREGEILGGAPFVSVGGRLRKTRWVSLPFTDVCPLLTSPSFSSSRLASLAASAADDAGAASLEIRAALGDGVGVETAHGVVHTLLLSDPDTLFGSFASQVRRNIRKAEKSNLTVRLAEQPEDLSRVYFALHAETRRRLGVPTQPRRLFKAVWERMVEPGLAFVLLAYHEGTAVAGAVFLDWNGRIIYKYGASDRRSWPLRPNNLIFWEAIRQGCASGARSLDFGRSDRADEGLRAFKSSWGAVEEELRYTSYGDVQSSSEAAPGRLLRPMLRIAPTWVSRSLGEVLYRFAA